MDTFLKRNGNKINISSTGTNLKYWLNSSLVGIISFVMASLYLFASRGNFDLYIANKALANASLILIGLSMALSGICYFWDFADKKISYRKYIGVVGFVMALIHAVISLWFLPKRFNWAFFLDNLETFIPGLLALVLLAGMVLLSHQHAAKKVGGALWRKLLRWLGYSAVILIIVHFGLMKYKGWIKWFKTGEPALPPLSFWIVIFAIAVLVLRVCLWLAEKTKSK